MSSAKESLKKAEEIYEDNFGRVDKRTAKVKRNICMLLLKSQEMKEALKECLELEELDRELFGEHSLQYAKNLKVIGTIFMILNRYEDAKQYYTQALKTLKLLGYQKLAKDIKEKLKAVCNQQVG